MKLKLSVIIVCIVGLFTIVGGLVAFDDRYAKYDQLCQVEYRLDQKIMIDKLFNLQNRQWRLQDRYGEEDAKKLEEYRALEQEKELINKQLK